MRTLKRHSSGRPQDDAKLRKIGGSGFKRPSKASKRAKKKEPPGYEEKASQTESDDSGKLKEFYEEHSEVEEVEEVAQREPTMYDDLLKKLGTHNVSVANAVRRRQREEQGKSDTDEDVDSDPESIESEEKDDGPKGGVELSGDCLDYIPPEIEDSGKRASVDDCLYFDLCSKSQLEITAFCIFLRYTSSALQHCTFDNHLSYKLASTEADNLLKRKWRYTWKMPALNMSNCNWRGTGACFKDLDINSYYGLKPRLYKHWLESYIASGGSEFHQSKQRSFFSIYKDLTTSWLSKYGSLPLNKGLRVVLEFIAQKAGCAALFPSNSYYDILHHNKKPFYLKGLEEDSNIIDAYLMHSLNHIFRSRDLVVKNERKLAKNQESVEGKTVNADAYLDRGFTRPKVLILLPLAGIARRVVKRLIQLTPSKHKANVENLERFYEEFGSGRTEDKNDYDDAEIPKSKKSTKPSDFQALLGRDNDNDHFMIAQAVQFFTDLAIAEALMLHALCAENWEAEVEKEKDVDYLSSIEILIIDHADVMLMQNWSHVNTVVEQLNRLPSKQHGTDIMRIRPWYLDGQARFYRQTIILGSHINPELNALFNQHCLNYRGKVKLECKYKGVLPKILIQVRQIYERFDTESIAEADDARLKYFCEKVFPKIKDSVQNGVMIFVSSYFEFVRLRNYLKSQAASFCLFGEYIKRNDISHVRGQFYRGEKKIMLYTERAHFYYRYKIVNLLEESDSMNCRVLFSRLDHLRLERIVGSTAAKRMVDSEKGVFVFA
ncbi:hypothetical protein DH2020_014796 [Rehmannia glutinosa]|uniref:U3 small nucleolar RNA-associated protein 25 n=1 Tax=Rehmannia glutinosa TaxID=99300 RepID=A0ABR0X001_REHGL